MLNPREDYLKICSQIGVEPDSHIEKAMAGLPELDLSHFSLTAEACKTLKEWLSSYRYVSKLSFADCLLESQSLCLVLAGLHENTSVHTLNLKGNNIYRDATTALAKMISRNTSIKRLSLEWNMIGECAATCRDFFDALKANTSLQYLDLRHNQLSASNGSDVARMLATNRSLLTVDLRWNKLGNEAGKSFLHAIKFNNCLIKCELNGNFRDQELMAAIENRLHENIRNSCSGRISTTTHKANHNAVNYSMKINKISNDSDKELMNERLSHCMELLNDTRHVLEDKELELKQTTDLSEKYKAEHDHYKNAFEQCEEKNHELEQRLAHLIQESQTKCEVDAGIIKQLQGKLNKLEEDKDKLEENLRKSLSDEEVKVQNYITQKSELMHEVTSLQGELRTLKEETDKTLEDQKNHYESEFNKFRGKYESEVEAAKKKWQEEMNKSGAQVKFLTEELSLARAQLVTQKAEFEAEKTSNLSNVSNLKARMKNEMGESIRSIENRMEVISKDKREVEQQLQTKFKECNDLHSQLITQQQKIRKLETENLELSGMVNNLRDDIHGREKEAKSKLRKKDEEMKSLLEQLDKMEQEITSLTRRLKHEQTNYETELDELRRAEKIREEEMQSRKNAEERARKEETEKLKEIHNVLCGHFRKYCSS